MPQDFTDEKATFFSSNGFVPPGNKPLPVPLLTQFYVAIWHLYILKLVFKALLQSPPYLAAIWNAPRK